MLLERNTVEIMIPQRPEDCGYDDLEIQIELKIEELECLKDFNSFAFGFVCDWATERINEAMLEAEVERV